MCPTREMKVRVGASGGASLLKIFEGACRLRVWHRVSISEERLALRRAESGGTIFLSRRKTALVSRARGAALGGRSMGVDGRLSEDIVVARYVANVALARGVGGEVRVS